MPAPSKEVEREKVVDGLIYTPAATLSQAIHAKQGPRKASIDRNTVLTYERESL
nr:hypothetical protein [Candidatus Njordarchaeum guaymaensis]